MKNQSNAYQIKSSFPLVTLTWRMIFHFLPKKKTNTTTGCSKSFDSFITLKPRAQKSNVLSYYNTRIATFSWIHIIINYEHLQILEYSYSFKNWIYTHYHKKEIFDCLFVLNMLQNYCTHFNNSYTIAQPTL